MATWATLRMALKRRDPWLATLESTDPPFPVELDFSEQLALDYNRPSGLRIGCAAHVAWRRLTPGRAQNSDSPEEIWDQVSSALSPF